MHTNRTTILALVLLGFTTIFSIVSTADDNNVFRSKAKYMNYVGTYYGEDGSIMTYHSDGTATGTDANMFTEDPSNRLLGRKTTPYLGAWKMVDQNVMLVTVLAFATEQFGHNYSPDGLIYKIKWLAVFDDPAKGPSPSYTIDKLTVEVFLVGQNPITDEPAAVVESPGTRSYRLIVD